MKHIIWDWNGTLINDVDLSCEVLNSMLAARGREPVSVERYRAIYQHPIQLIYERCGFDLLTEPFETLSGQWHAGYLQGLPHVTLYPDVRETLARLRHWGFTQSLLSALPHDVLVQSVRQHGVGDFFAGIQGLDNRLAKSKLDEGRRLLGSVGATPGETVFIGDSSHDAEVAGALDCACLLVARGFEDRARLERHGYPVFENFDELLSSPLLSH